MPRLFKNIGFAILFLVAVLILVNIFVIMPRMHLKPEKTALVQREVIKSAEPEAAVITIDTLAVIKQTGGGEGADQAESDNKSSRNPFFWPGEKLQQKTRVKGTATNVAPQKTEPPKPLLSMVIIGEGRKQALIDNVFVREGEMFHGCLVKRITGNKVILADELGEMSIYLSNVEKTDDKSQPTAGLIER